MKSIALQMSGGKKPLHRQIETIIDKSNITIVFQPIVSLRDGSVLGYEALARGPVDSPLYYPDALFDIAEEAGKLWELEQLCRTKALEAAFESHQTVKLFLNVNTAVIHDDLFRYGFTKEYLDLYGIDPANIFFEISEKSAIEDLKSFKIAIDHYKKQDYKIAIDDAGAGYSGLNMITDVHPHYIKLDMNLIRDIDKDAYKRALVKSLYDFTCITGIQLIAEGIETEEEMRTLVGIGVQYGQGYFIQVPKREILNIDEAVLSSIHACNAQKNNLHRSVSSFFIGYLCYEGVVVGPNEQCGTVYNYFLHDENLPGVTVIDEAKQVLGSVSRQLIDHRLSGQYGFSMFAKKPITDIMDTLPLVVDFSTPIDVVAERAMSRPIKTLYDSIVVKRKGEYSGTVSIKDLLEKTMEIEIMNSRHLNPLSGLPGNLAIEQNIEKCIQSNDPFTILYMDLDNFKAYNDVYGFGNGDKVIRFVAKILTQQIPPDCFVGHIGGDDFVAILPTYHADDLCNRIVELFDAGITTFYSETDQDIGYITTKNRKGEEERFPIITISIAGIRNKTRGFRDAEELSIYAGMLKKQCKLIWKSCYLLC